MLRKLTNINSISVVQQNLSHNIYGLAEIHYEENEVGKGAVGTVFKVVNIDGRTETGLLLKLITDIDFAKKSYETISILHDKLNKHQNNTGTPALIEVPELNGLPFMAFKASIEDMEEDVAGFLMRDLTFYEYNDFGSDSWNKEKYITDIGFEEKLYLCYQFARAVDFLHDQKFIHADLKDYSIFINVNRPQLSIIDYDGGYHYDKQEFALTLGAITAWASPWWRKIIGQGKSARDVTTAERLGEENWILASGLFEILFGMPPFYFLKNIEEETINAYLQKSKWPEINENSEEINLQNVPFHKALTNIINGLSDQGLKPLIDTFIKVFNHGHKKESKRLTPRQWKTLLYDINKDLVGKPRIDGFSSSTQTINAKNEKVEFTWDTHFYSAVYIENQLQDPLKNTGSLNIEDDQEIVIKVVNDFGTSTEKLNISTNKVNPIVHEFTTNIQKRIDLSPVFLRWKTSNCKLVSISNLGSDFEAVGTVEITPLEKTRYILTAVGFFDQKVLAEIEIDVDAVKIISFKYEINIERGIDNVDLFWKTENANEVEINPKIGKIDLSGATHICINDKTDFTLTAKGYFNEIHKTIEAQPFPIPIIKGIFIPTPRFNLSTTIPDNLLEAPEVLNKNFSVNFCNTITFNEVGIPFEKIQENILAESINKNKRTAINVSKLFNNLFKKVYKSKQ